MDSLKFLLSLHTELELFLRHLAKWALAIICRPGKLKFFLEANRSQI